MCPISSRVYLTHSWCVHSHSICISSRHIDIMNVALNSNFYSKILLCQIQKYYISCYDNDCWFQHFLRLDDTKFSLIDVHKCAVKKINSIGSTTIKFEIDCQKGIVFGICITLVHWKLMLQFHNDEMLANLRCPLHRQFEVCYCTQAVITWYENKWITQSFVNRLNI